MGPYRPDGPSPDEPAEHASQPERSEPNPTKEFPRAETDSGASGTSRSGFDSPNPTLAMPQFGSAGGFAEPEPAPPIPGMPNPLAGLGYPAAPAGDENPSPTEEPDVGGAVYPPPGDPATTESPHGSISFQEPGVTQPRPPTVAEARARDKARKRAQEAEEAAAAALEAKRRKRKKALIGGGAVVGVAALIGAGYLACSTSGQPEVTAYCVADGNGQSTVVNDNDCVAAQNYATNQGIYHSGLPAVFFFNGHQYHYYYGGSNTIGRPPTGGSFSEPSGAHISTKSGTVVRGGLGSKSGGKSGGS